MNGKPVSDGYKSEGRDPFTVVRRTYEWSFLFLMGLPGRIDRSGRLLPKLWVKLVDVVAMISASSIDLNICENVRMHLKIQLIVWPPFHESLVLLVPPNYSKSWMSHFYFLCPFFVRGGMYLYVCIAIFPQITTVEERVMSDCSDDLRTRNEMVSSGKQYKEVFLFFAMQWLHYAIPV